MVHKKQGKNAVTLTRNGLTVECFFNETGRLARKIERYGRQSTEHAYAHDAKGRLTEVRRDGVVTERYQYNRRGQRIERHCEYRGFGDSAGGALRYDDDGRLIRAGGTAFYYDERGALAERCDSRGVTEYFYGKDTMPDRIVLPSGVEIRYEYDRSNPTGPARRYRNGTLTAEFVWSGPLQLAAYKDHDTMLEYAFSYDGAGILNTVRIGPFELEEQESGADTDWAAESSDWLGTMAGREKRQRLHDVSDRQSVSFELFCGCDQVGTLKILTDKNGKLVKEIVRDSFGVQQNDSFPDLFIPIGFAGGLTDPDTGLVRFGYRDYDPEVGRFTAPDPLGDTGGDHDVYEYCIDDPVTMNDPSGLFPPLLLFLGGKALALGIAAAGTYGSAWVADKIKGARDGEKSTVVVDSVNKVAPKVAAASVVSALPGAAVMAPGAVTAAGQRAGAAIHATRHGDKIVKGAQIAEAFINPNAPAIPSGTAFVGTAAARVAEDLQRKRERNKK